MAKTDKPNILFIMADDIGWFFHHGYILIGAWALAEKFAATMEDFPPVQRPGSFTIDDALKTMNEAGGSGGR